MIKYVGKFSHCSGVTGDEVKMENTEIRCRMSNAIGSALTKEYGAMIGGDDLRRVLGLRTQEAFRQALARKKLPVAVFNVPNRRGKFALVIDIANWLAKLRLEAGTGGFIDLPDLDTMRSSK